MAAPGTTPTEQELANEIYNEYATEIGATHAAQLEAVGALKVKEAQAEGEITASTAARGLKVGGGSELSKLVAQQTAGAEAITYQRTQGEAILSGMAQEQNVALGRAEINATLQLQQQQAQQAQQESNTWLSLFQTVTGAAASLLSSGLLTGAGAAAASVAAPAAPYYEPWS